ncbi:MAG: hydantoinase/oxoprolinase family protein, partial [Candidatus Dormibacteraceae bacterium]
ACYGRGSGESAALTDAFLVAGMLSAGQRLGGKLELQLDPARRALERLGGTVGLGAEEVADGAVQVAIAMTAAEATTVLARRGVDAPDFRMVAFGGAGPVIAALLAEEIYIDQVLIPPAPGALSAFGAARADLEGDLVVPVYRMLGELPPDELRARQRALGERVADWLAEERRTLAIPGAAIEYSADMRYDGQGYDVTVDLELEWLEGPEMEAIAGAFHRTHERTYGHRNEGARVWLKELRAHVIGRPVKPAKGTTTTIGAGGGAGGVGTRQVRLRGETATAEVHQRSDLGPRTVVKGPAIVEQMDTTTVIPPGWSAETLTSGSMILVRG